ncbi:primosomal protein N' [candidate division KSB1 bacterium]|nr:primosomal protein N' [candidate division KSB1 bacterium]
MNFKFAEIAVPLPIRQLFTYRIPAWLEARLQSGMRVLVPFGRRSLTGYVVHLAAETSVPDLRDIEDVLDDAPSLQPDLMALAQWISDYYLCAPGEVFKAMLPAGTTVDSDRHIQLKPVPPAAAASKPDPISERQQQILTTLAVEGELSVKMLQKKIGSNALHYNLQQLVAKNRIEISYKLQRPKVKPKFEKFVRFKHHFQAESEFQTALTHLDARLIKYRHCLQYLWEQKNPVRLKEFLQQVQISSRSLKNFLTTGWLEIIQQEVHRDYYATTATLPLETIVLNPEQNQALSEISTALLTRTFKAFLLHGVTGSGKTQVYIEALKQVIARGQGGIVLVPEISLTPQTVRRFQSNFPGLVAVQHSRMSPGERFDAWRKLKAGAYRIVVGARSAIFAPIQSIGLIIVDEEHETSYKQFETAPLYHARDVAMVRARMNNAVTLLGSATPAIESYYNALNQKYQLVSLPHRIDDLPMPSVTIVDLMREHRVYGFENTQIFSMLLKKKISEKLDRGEQIILLQNRRGFAPTIRCQNCGYIEMCENCNITLTYHKQGLNLRCHYCGFAKSITAQCPECGKQQIIYKGVGTQKVEAELAQLFPDARVVRMDLDTTSGKLAHDRIIIDFGAGKYDILLGTQMVAKGLDFHRVTLVGVISADTGLFLPDFRASERTFQLLTQVAGRAGRKGAQGEVVIQTYSPDHVCLLFAQHHDFLGFYSFEEKSRQELNYPPYGRLVLILFKGEIDAEVAQAANHFKQSFSWLAAGVEILGPAPAPVTRIQNQYRWHLVFKSSKATDPSGAILRRAVTQAAKNFRETFGDSKVKLVIDVDPLSMF